MRRDADSSRDVFHTLQARNMLVQEPELAHLNIGVYVQNRVATLWGPVPSAACAFRAELCLRMMVELVEVHNELYVHEQQEPLRRQLKIDSRPMFLPAQIPPSLPAEPRLMPVVPGMLPQ